MAHEPFSHSTYHHFKFLFIFCVSVYLVYFFGTWIVKVQQEMERCGPSAASFYFVVWGKTLKVAEYKTSEKKVQQNSIGLSMAWVTVTQSVV